MRELAGAASLAAVLLAGFAFGAALAVLLGAVWIVLRDAAGTRVLLRRRAELLVAVRVLVAELDAGARPPAALVAAADVAPLYERVLRAAAEAAASGGDAGGALVDAADTQTMGVAWQLGQSTGMALSGVLERVATDLGAADEQRRVVAVALWTALVGGGADGRGVCRDAGLTGGRGRSADRVPAGVVGVALPAAAAGARPG